MTSTLPRGRPRLPMTGISKRFGAVRAIRSADLTVQAGQRARAGRRERRRQVHPDQDHRPGPRPPTPARIEFEGAPVTIATHHATPWPSASPPSTRSRSCSPSSPSRRTSSSAARSARAAGSTGRRRTPRSSSCSSCSACPPRYATVPVGDLSIAEQQQVSIAKALAGDAKVLILDEPSAILTDAEIEVLFGVVRRLTESGVVGHLHLAPARRAVPDRRRGHGDARRADHRHLPDRRADGAPDRRADGRRHPLRRAARARDRRTASRVLELDGPRPRAASSTTSTSSVRPGEIVGLYGLVGSGVSEIAACIYGIDRADRRRDPARRQARSRPRSPRQAQRLGIALLPANRKHRGDVLASSPSRSTSRPGTCRCCRRLGVWMDRARSARSPRT